MKRGKHLCVHIYVECLCRWYMRARTCLVGVETLLCCLQLCAVLFVQSQ